MFVVNEVNKLKKIMRKYFLLYIVFHILNFVGW